MYVVTKCKIEIKSKNEESNDGNMVENRLTNSTNEDFSDELQCILSDFLIK